MFVSTGFITRLLPSFPPPSYPSFFHEWWVPSNWHQLPVKTRWNVSLPPPPFARPTYPYSFPFFPRALTPSPPPELKGPSYTHKYLSFAFPLAEKKGVRSAWADRVFSRGGGGRANRRKTSDNKGLNGWWSSGEGVERYTYSPVKLYIPIYVYTRVYKLFLVKRKTLKIWRRFFWASPPPHPRFHRGYLLKGSDEWLLPGVLECHAHGTAGSEWCIWEGCATNSLSFDFSVHIRRPI